MDAGSSKTAFDELLETVAAMKVDEDGDGAHPLLKHAQTAEEAERYPDMCRFMRRYVQTIHAQEPKDGVESQIDEMARNLLSVAYKNVVGLKRSSLRTLNNPESLDDTDPKAWDELKVRVTEELTEVCLEVIGLLGARLKESIVANPSEAVISKETYLDGSLLLRSKTEPKETQVFYLKMVGDYARYLAENENKTTGMAKLYAKVYYTKAYEIACESLPETSPTRLGLALNYSVCNYEILDDKTKACQIAKKAFDDAIEKLDTLKDASYKDSTLIMQLLRDNLTLWTSQGDATDDV